jgi:hypothetical protein
VRSICVGLAILIGSVLGGARAKDSPQVGGPGGGPFDDACHGTDVLVGYNESSGKAMNTIAAVCQAQKDGVLEGANYGLHTWGVDDSGPGLGATFHSSSTPRCPPGQAISELHVWVNKFNEIDSVSATCTALLRPTTGDYPRSYLERYGGGSGQAVRDGPTGCPANTIATGLTGRSGALIDSLGLKCSPFPWHPAFEPGPPPPHFVKVIRDVDIYSRPQPGPNDQPKGTLALGTAGVTIVAEGAPDNPNWYELSWPGGPPGEDWVYSAPPNTPNDFTSLDCSALPGGRC